MTTPMDAASVGEDWIGQTPHHWSVRKLGFMFDLISSGTTPPTENRDFYDGDVPWITTSELRENLIVEANAKLTRRAIEVHSALRVYDVSTILIAMYGATIGRLGILGIEAATNQACCALARPRGTHPKFVYYALLAGRVVLIEQASGGGQPNINQEKIRAFKIPAPPLSEQIAIADFLDNETAKIDALITTQEELIQRIVEKRVASVTRAVCGLDSQNEMRETGNAFVPTIPSGWKLLPLRRLLDDPLTYGANEAGDRTDVNDPRYVRITDISEDGSLRTDTFRSLPKDIANPYILVEGDILLARSGATVGKSFIYRSSWGVCCFAGYLIRARVKKGLIRAPFLHRFLSSQIYWGWVRSNEIQATIQNISAERYYTLPVPLPPLDEQVKILALLDDQSETFEALTRTCREAVSVLIERRLALITAAVTGKIDVRGTSIKAVSSASNDNQQTLRVVVGAEIVARHGAAKNFGRVKFQKLLYLAEVHTGISELGGNYVREAAGPLARDLLSETEHGMAKGGFYKAVAPVSENDGVAYERIGAVGAHSDQFTALLGEKAAPLAKLIDLLKDYSTRDVEAITTLYAVWNDALLDGESPDDARIIQGFLDEWHPEKRVKFKPSDLPVWLAWMRRNGVVPSGNGAHTYTDQLFV